MHILTPASATWTPPVITISGLHGKGLDDLWSKIEDHRQKLTATGEIEERRRKQDVKWMWALVHERLHQKLTGSKEVRKATADAEKSVASGEHSPAAGAQAIAELIGL